MCPPDAARISKCLAAQQKTFSSRSRCTTRSLMEEMETEKQEACEYIQSICADTVSSDQHTSAYIKSCSKEASAA